MMLDGNEKIRKDVDLHSVPVPEGLDKSQQKRALLYVEGTVLKGLSPSAFCDEYGVSRATMWNDRHLKNEVFNQYIQRLTNACISESEIADHEVIKRNIRKKAMSGKATREDYNLYERFFPYIIEYDRVKNLNDLGVKGDGKSFIEAGGNKSTYDKTQSILSRLQD